MIAISKTPGLLITFGTISVVDLSKRRIITECVTNITKYTRFGILFETCSRVSHLNFTRESSFKGTPLDWALAKVFED